MTDLRADRNARLMGPYLDEVASSVVMPERGLDQLLATVATTPQRRRYMLPRLARRSLSGVDTVKFALAGVIVALSGGFLLTGGLTQPPESDSLIAGSTPAASTTPVESIQAELLPDVELVTEQVAPTVFRVVDDGPEHNLGHIWQVEVDQEDAVWVLTMQPNTGKYPRIFRLGQPGAYTPANGIPKYVSGIEVGTDDRLYAYTQKPNTRVTLDDWVVLTEQGWMPATKEDRQAANRRPDKSVGTNVIAADGTTWEVDRYIYHHGPDGRTEYRLEDMGFTWGKKWLKETGLHKIRPRELAAAPDGRVWSLWAAHHGNSSFTPGLALAEFDGTTWKDITPRQWRYRSTWPFGDDRSGEILGASMSVEVDGTLKLTAPIGGDIQWSSLVLVARVVARWDGNDWAIESRTTWDLASIPKPTGPLAWIWTPQITSDDTMILQIGWDALDTLLYVIEPEIDDSLDEDALSAP